MSHRPTIRASVEWVPGTPTDVTGLLVSFAAPHGGSTAAVERPLADPADGHVTLEVTDTATRTGRYLLTVTSDGHEFWEGWMSEPRLVDARRRTRWRLTGRSAETLARQSDVSRPAGSALATIAAIATVDTTGLVDRRHRQINAQRSAGEMLSLLAGALNAELVERRDGALRAASRSPASRAGATPIAAATMFVAVDVESFDAANRIRNRVVVQTAGTLITPDVAAVLTSAATRNTPRSARNGATIRQTITFDLPDDGRTYSDIAVDLTGAEITWRKDAAGGGRFTATSEIAGVCTLSTPTVSGRTVTVTVTIPADQPRARAFYTDLPSTSALRGNSTNPSGFWWYPGSTTGTVHERLTSYLAERIEFTARLQATASGDLTPAQFSTVIDSESIAAWGVRELRRPDWLIETVASGEALLAALAELRRTHEFTLPLQQPTAALSQRAATLDAGDYATLTMIDAVRGVALAGVHTMITHRTPAVNDVGEAFARFVALETGIAPEVPAAPTSVAAAPTAGGLAVTWDAPTGGGPAADYEIQWGTTTAYDTGSATAAATSHTISGLTAGTLYYVRVRARNAGGNSAWATTTGTPAAGLQPPTAPRTVTATAGDATIAVAWAAPAGGGAPSGYRVEWGTGGAYTLGSADLASAARSYQITGLTNGTTYNVRVRASNTAGNSAWATATATPAAATQAPGTPTGLAATPGNGQVTLAWTAPTTGGAATYYRVFYKAGTASSQPTDTTAWSPNPTASPVTITGLTNGTSYAFWVLAGNSEGESSLAGPAAATPAAAATAPAKPAPPTLSPGDGTLVATWAAPDDGGAAITDYDVQVRAGASGAYSTWPHTGTARTVTISGLTNGTAYEVRIRATNSVGPSAWSDPRTATPTSARIPGPAIALVRRRQAGQAFDMLVRFTSQRQGGTPASYLQGLRPAASAADQNPAWRQEYTRVTSNGSNPRWFLGVPPSTQVELYGSVTYTDGQTSDVATRQENTTTLSADSPAARTLTLEGDPITVADDPIALRENRSNP